MSVSGGNSRKPCRGRVNQRGEKRGILYHPWRTSRNSRRKSGWRWIHAEAKILPFVIQHLEGDCRQILPTLPARSVNCAITSPPYWAQRSYLAEDNPAKPLEIGREETVKEYIDNLVAVFREVSRVLMNDGTLWVNLGDAYADKKEKARAAGVKIGDLIGLPWRLAFALQADGWLLLSEVIWANGQTS